MKRTICHVFPAVNSNTTICPELNVLIRCVRFVCVMYILVKKNIDNRLKNT